MNQGQLKTKHGTVDYKMLSPYTVEFNGVLTVKQISYKVHAILIARSYRFYGPYSRLVVQVADHTSNVNSFTVEQARISIEYELEDAWEAYVTENMQRDAALTNAIERRDLALQKIEKLKQALKDAKQDALKAHHDIVKFSIRES